MTKCAKEKPLGKKLGEYLNYNKFIFAAFFLPLIIMGVVFGLQKFYPFGNNMILVVDAWHQYFPFLTEYQNILQEGSSMLYSFNVGGGVNFYGVIANYLACPLYLLTYFIPASTPWLVTFLAFTVALKLGVAGMSFALLLRKVFARNDLSLVTFSMLYAFCAYIMGYYWNMMWLDTVAIMPLVIAGVVGVLRDKKFSLYIISLALSVIFSFYIGYMVCIFVLLFSICYTAVSFVSIKASLKNAGKMLLYTGIAFMLTAFITIPTLSALSTSDSAAALDEFPKEYSVNYGYGYGGSDGTLWTTVMALVRTGTNLLSFTRPIYMDTGLPNIACGALTLVLLPFYFTTRKINLKEKVVSAALCIFMLLSLVINQLNYIWHGMNTPAMVFYRFSFIFSFILIFMAYRAYALLDSFGKKTFIISSCLLAAYLGLSLFLQRKLSVLVTFAAAVVIITGFILYRKKKLKKQVLSALLCLFVVCESSLTAYYAVSVVGSTKIDSYPKNYSQVTELAKIADSHSEGELVRTEFASAHCLNDSALYGTYGISTFNSMCDKSYSDFFSEIGLSASKANNRYVYHQGTPVIDMLLGIKYNITRDSDVLLDTAHKTQIATADECALYENDYYLPSGFMASKELLNYKLHEKAFLPSDGQNDIFSLATGIEKDVLELIPSKGDFYGEVKDFVVKQNSLESYYEVNLNKNPLSSSTDPVVYIDFEIPEDGSFYCSFFSSATKAVNVYVNSDMENPIEINEKYAGVYALGNYKKGDILTAEYRFENNTNNRFLTSLFKLDEEVLKAGYEKLSQDTMKLEEMNNQYIRGTIDVTEEGLFTTSVLYDEGYKAYVDGKEVDITPVGDTLIAFELPEGTHTIELRYSTPGLGFGIIVSCIGLLSFIGLCIFEMLRKKKYSESEVCDTTVKEVFKNENRDKINSANSEDKKE